jgi:hypothetical protein
VDFLQGALNASGQAYDTVVVDAAPRPDFASLMWNADGTGKYAGYIM